MVSRLNPYIGFRDNAREALEFYKSVLGGELSIMTFGQIGASHTPADDGKVMHGQLETSKGFTLMAADTPADMELAGNSNISVSLSGEDEAELRSYWNKLVVGGTVTAPFEKAPWGDVFGMVTDRFGTQWMVNVSAPR